MDMEVTEDQLSWGKAIQGILDAKKPNIKITLLSDSKGVWLYSKCVDSPAAHRYKQFGHADTRLPPEHTADKIIRFWDRRPSTQEHVMTRADIPCPCDPGGSRLNCPYHRDVRLACEEADHD